MLAFAGLQIPAFAYAKPLLGFPFIIVPDTPTQLTRSGLALKREKEEEEEEEEEDEEEEDEEDQRRAHGKNNKFGCLYCVSSTEAQPFRRILFISN